jgi:predicted transcriptional regulator/DNA-binding HxlR family transcriptional regulator
MIEGTLNKPKNGANNRDLVEMLKDLGARCRTCAPLNPLECVTRCNLWKLKNELRQLRDTMDDPNFIKELFNVLKNNTRLHILLTIVKGRHSISRLQEELKKAGYSHSCDTISQEYLQPLMQVGLAAEAQEQYYATTFGGKLTDFLQDFSDFVDVLPAHSECYEETLLDAMLSGPKTFEDMATFVSPKLASRILKRLKTSGLIETPEERDYVFFFRSKRDPSKESLSVTERKVYTNISDDGIAARKLAEKTDVSLRRTYKYLRGLKGKKLVFTRKIPKVYRLTKKGEKLAQLLRGLQGVVEDVWQSSWHVVTTEKS